MKEPVCNVMNMHPNTKAVCDLINAGTSPEDAYQIVKPGKELTRANKHELLKKSNTLALADPKRIQAAQKAIDSILKGKVVGDAKTINTSDILNAVKMVADRVDPIVNQSLIVNAKVEISPVDLSNYLNN